jgi:hypothetical protein
VPKAVALKGDGAAPADVPLPRARPKDVIADAGKEDTTASAKSRH